MRILIFGLGYVGAAFAGRLGRAGWEAAATTRGEPGPVFSALGIEAVRLDRAAEAAGAADAVLITAAPDDHGCRGLNLLGEALKRAGRARWIGYLSTTGVYGDRDGGWVFEDSPLRARSVEGARREAAEKDWLTSGLPAAVFRLPGIYGPGRSAFDRLRAGQARNIVRPGQVFSRIHVEDLADALLLSLARPRAGGVYNLCDDEPAAAHLVTDYAARLLGVAPPAAEPFETARLSPAASRFYAESKRVANARAKSELGWRPAFPSYREGLAAVLAAEAA